MNIKILKIFTNFTIFLIFFFSFSMLALPVWFDLIVTLTFFLFIKDLKIIFITSITIIASSLIFSFMWGSFNQEDIFYRPHEKWLGKDFYKENVNDLMLMPYGDIYSMIENSKRKELSDTKEPRVVKFKTDKYGLRNNLDIMSSDILLVGDSFIVGNGITQEKIPSEILSNLTNKKIANIAFPGGPKSYENNIKKFMSQLPSETKIILFYFEGNDFGYDNQSEDKKNNSKFFSNKNKLYQLWVFYTLLESFKDEYLKKIYPNYQVFFKLIRRNSYNINQNIFDKLYFVYKKNIKKEKVPKKNKYLVKKINQQNNLFFNKYVTQTQNMKNFKTYILNNENILEKLEYVFFIPTKYRVYSKYFNENTGQNLPLNFLKNEYEKLDIPVFDLTDILRNELYEKNNFVYWKDDTHWNHHGIKVAMKYVKKIIEN